MFVLTLTLVHYYTKQRPQQAVNSSISFENSRRTSFVVCSIYTVVLLVVAVSPSTVGNIYQDWNSIGTLSIIRAVMAIALCFFLPGYSLVSMIDRRNRLKLLLRILLAYIVSVLLTGSIGFIIEFTHFQFYHSTIALITINGIILFLYSVYSLFGSTKKLNPFGELLKIPKSRPHILSVFLCILGLIIIWTYLLYDFKLIGDQWFHHGRSLLFMTDSIANLSKLGLDAIYPPFFSSMLATYFSISGLPSVNAYVLISFLNIVPVLSFYFFFYQWAPRGYKNAAILATSLFVLSAGLGWIYVFYEEVALNPTSEMGALYVLHNGGIKTFDIRIPSSFIGVGHPDFSSPLLLVALPCGLIVLGLLKTEMRSRVTYLLIVGVLLVTGSIFHDEFYLFIIIGGIACILFKLKGKHMYYFLSLFVFALEILIDASTFSQYYTSRQIGNIPLMALILGFTSVLWLIYAKGVSLRLAFLSKLRSRFGRIDSRTRVYIGICVISIVVYLFTFTFIVWNQLSFKEIQLQTSEKGQRIVPWYLYPSRLGLSGILGLIYVATYIFRKFDNGVWIFVLIAFVSFIAGPYYDENRLTKYVELGFVCLASLLIVEIISKLKGRARPVFTSLIIGLVFLGSSVSVLLYISYSSLGLRNEEFTAFSDSIPRRFFPSSSEIFLLNNLHRNIINASTDFVTAPYKELARNQGLGAKLEGFVDSSITKFQQNPLILNSTTLEGLYTLLSSGNIKFIVVPLQRTSQTQTDPVKFVEHYFPQRFNDGQHEVIKVPPINSPSANSTVGLIYRDQEVVPSKADSLHNIYRNQTVKEFNHFLPLTALALSNNTYDVFRSDDLSALQKKTLILPSELLTPLLVDFAKNGGHLVLLDNFSNSTILSNSSLVKLNGSAKFDRIENVDGSMISMSGTVPSLRMKDTNANVTANYYFKNNTVSPFSVNVRFGKGHIDLLNIDPVFNSVVNNKSSNYLFSLVKILTMAKIQPTVGEHSEIVTLHPPPRVFGPIKILGNASITTESFSLRPPSKIIVSQIELMKRNKLIPVANNTELSNLTILGKAKIVIESKKVTMPISSDYDYITTLIPGTFNLRIETENQSSVWITTIPNSKPLVITEGSVKLKGIVIKNFNNRDIPLDVKSPRIKVNGTLDFERMYSPDPRDPTKGWAFNEHVILKGFVDFTLVHSDSPLSGVNPRTISYIVWNNFSATSNIISETIRFPADISALAKQRNSEVPVLQAFISTENVKTIILIAVLCLVCMWFIRIGPRVRIQK